MHIKFYISVEVCEDQWHSASRPRGEVTRSFGIDADLARHILFEPIMANLVFEAQEKYEADVAAMEGQDEQPA